MQEQNSGPKSGTWDCKEVKSLTNVKWKALLTWTELQNKYYHIHKPPV